VAATTATTRLAAHVRDLRTGRPWRPGASAVAPATWIAGASASFHFMFATSGRAQLAYESTGVHDGADVLLIHAGVNDRRSWQHVVERLGPRHRCVAYDMRGFGETTYQREDGWSPVGDALAVLDAAGLQQPVVVACSMGGQAAIDLALAHPDRVAGLVLIGTAVRDAPYPELTQGPTAELMPGSKRPTPPATWTR
jgi:pimeloyl-ACP methyl ester carboxylesterase